MWAASSVGRVTSAEAEIVANKTRTVIPKIICNRFDRGLLHGLRRRLRRKVFGFMSSVVAIAVNRSLESDQRAGQFYRASFSSKNFAISSSASFVSANWKWNQNGGGSAANPPRG